MNFKDYKKKQGEKSRRRNSAGLVTLTAVFIISMGGFLGLGLAFPLRPDYSVSEKRELKKIPSLTRASLMDGTYFNGVSDWFQDTFPFREFFLSCESGIHRFYGVQTEAVYGGRKSTEMDELPAESAGIAPTLAVGSDQEESSAASDESASESASKESTASETTAFETNADGTLVIKNNADADSVEVTGETAGNIYVSGNAAYEIYYFNQAGALKYASTMNTVKSLLPDVNVYDMIVPNSFGVELDPALQSKLGSGNMKEVIDYVYSMLSPEITSIPVFDALSAHKGEYIYFRTDHHWTQLGAYYAYQEFAKAKGVTAHSLSDYEKREYDGFYGTFYFATDRAEALKENPDTITAYVPISTNDMTYRNKSGDTQNGRIINDASWMNAGNRYNCYILGDNPITEIHNPNLTDGSSAVVVKESYGNCFVPFLVDHYQNLYIIDYRYYDGDLADFVKSNGVKDVLFLNNIMAVSEKASGKILGLFG